jgi:hypothetical protein
MPMVSKTRHLCIGSYPRSLGTNLDRLARGLQYPLEIAERMRTKSADLCIPNLD